MTRARGAAGRAVVQRANQIKLRRRRHFPGGAAFESRLFNMRQVQQAVSLIGPGGVVILTTRRSHDPRRSPLAQRRHRCR